MSQLRHRAEYRLDPARRLVLAAQRFGLPRPARNRNPFGEDEAITRRIQAGSQAERAQRQSSADG
jgi:hypothetical protein